MREYRTRDFQQNNKVFQISYQNSRASIVCLLPILFPFPSKPTLASLPVNLYIIINKYILEEIIYKK